MRRSRIIRHSRITLAAAALLLAATTASPTESVAPADVLERLFQSPEIEEGWFAPNFLSAVPAAEVERIIGSLTERYGHLQAVRGSGDRFVVALRDAEVPVRLALDADGRIAGLMVEPPVASSGTLEEYVAEIAALPGRTSVLVATAGEVRAAHAPEVPLAVGSAAKLAILKAVQDAVIEDRLAWHQVVRLDERWRSLPSGILQDWPDGSPVTVATLANLAASQSDNTATDALLDLVGREAVDAIYPRSMPFLSTRELFILKARASAQLRSAWADAGPRRKRRFLDGIAGAPLPAAADLETDLTIEVEWFLSATELCDLLEATAGLEALRINPGVADPADWDGIAYKGGSETGVLNLSTRVVARDGTAHCVVATWNGDEALDEERMVASYRAIVAALAATAE